MGKNFRREYRFNGADKQTFRQMIRMCRADYPCQTFVGVDSELRPCVITAFDDCKGENTVNWWHFSKWRVAVKAFTELKKFLDEQLQADMRENAELLNVVIRREPCDLPF